MCTFVQPQNIDMLSILLTVFTTLPVTTQFQK